MANKPFAPPSNKRSRYSGAIADVNLDAFQGILAIMNEDEIRRVENPSAPSAYAISDGRGKNGMFDWERFECNPTNFCWCSLVDDVAIFERGMLQFLGRGYSNAWFRTIRCRSVGICAAASSAMGFIGQNFPRR
jgi:hypothetical protein